MFVRIAAMNAPHSLIVSRGAPIPLPQVLVTAAELFGGHLRPDVDLAAFSSAPVRVQRQADRGGGTRWRAPCAACTSACATTARSA